jgi:hypothetical protein
VRDKLDKNSFNNKRIKKDIIVSNKKLFNFGPVSASWPFWLSDSRAKKHSREWT